MLTRKEILFCRFQFKGQLTIARPPTPDDSGLEDDMTVVPADTLFELLRRTFHLTQEKFQQFEHQIYRYHQKKDPSRVNTPIAVGGATFIISLTENGLCILSLYPVNFRSINMDRCIKFYFNR